jgi:hypothetical protein
MMPTRHRYILQAYTGPASRYTCPNCDKARTFTRYLDTRTNELLEPHFGKCDRDDKCSYHLSPYHPGSGTGGLSYRDQVYLANKASPTHGATLQRFYIPNAAAGIEQISSVMVEPATIPLDLLQTTLCRYSENSLARLLWQHFGVTEANRLLARFTVGTSNYWHGACVFWLTDEYGRVRGGQVVEYDTTGHTVKTSRSDGSERRHTTWVHTALSHSIKQRKTELPAWLVEYNQPETQKSPCLFGLPQLHTTPLEQPVAIVESAKTAIFCTPYFPNFTWLATMGKSYLTAERLAPLRGRHIVLWPDAGAFADWQKRASELRLQGFDVTVSDYLESTSTPAQLASGYDLADMLLDQWLGYPVSWDESEPVSKAELTDTASHRPV